MSRRDNAHRRCPACRLLDACICDLVPRLATRTRVVLLVHADEARKPTNSGLLAARCLQNVDVVIVDDSPPPPLALPAGTAPLVLFPGEGAAPLARTDQPACLVVPDGTWRQARKLRTRVPGLVDVPCAVLPPGPPTEYVLRTERRPGGLATLEAIARALAVLEGDDAVAEAMLVPFRAFVARTLAARGQPPPARNLSRPAIA